MFRHLSYFFSRGLKSLWKNRLMSIASICIIAAGLLLFGVSGILGLNVSSVAAQLQEQCEINVYLKPGSTAQDVVGEELKRIPGVKEVRFYSKEDRLQTYKETEYAGKEYLLEDLEENNPLRDSYIVRLNDLKDAKLFLNSARNIDGVDEIISREDMMGKLTRVISFTQSGGIWLMVILALIAMFIVANTIRLGLAARQNEIAIMKSVGATRRFITGPYLIEGLLVCLIGAGIAAGLLLWGYSAILPGLSEFLNPLSLIPLNQIVPVILIGFLGAALVIGLFGSLLSIRKFVRL